MGGTTTVQTVDLVSGLTEALASLFLFLLLLSTKPFSTKGLSCPEESELGEPSTVSHPLSCSSSDKLSKNKSIAMKQRDFHDRGTFS